MLLGLFRGRAALFSAINRVGMRQFNTGTLANIRKYLSENKEEISVEKNESGFLRVRFEDSKVPEILTNDQGEPLTEEELENIKALRLNFWQLGNTDHSLGDASIHCHPRGFKSYVIDGGYRAANYEESSNEEGDAYFKFELNKPKASVIFLGQFHLKKTEDVHPQEGDTVAIDDTQIHQVTEYNSTGVSTLTVNMVLQQGKGLNYIYMGQKQREAVKLTRKNLSSKESIEVVEEMIEILDNKLEKVLVSKP